MKKLKILIMLLFFLCNIFIFTNIFINTNKKNNIAQANSNSIELNIISEEKIQKYTISIMDENVSEVKKKLINEQDIVKIVNNLKKLKFSNEEISKYLFPKISEILKELESNINKQEKNDEIFVYENQCKLKIKAGENGIYLNKEKFFENFLKQIIEKNKKINLKPEIGCYKNQKLDTNDFLKKSEFSTNFKSSSEERKNNIKVALKNFDGLILNEGEVFSFNKVTGVRNKNSGYLPAKIISGGTFIEGYGGGVCQVSTTIYNACLLAGLEVLEVHSHSLPVSYVEPSFDAMVNQGSSDLVIRNNTGGKIVITTSSIGDVCKVVVFGNKNAYNIEKVSKKTGIIEANKDEIIETDYKKYGIENLEYGEEKRISFAKDGFYSEGYLNYYDKSGNLIKTEKIRECKYNPTKGIIVKKES